MSDSQTTILYTATLKARIDTDGIFAFIKRDEKEKVTIIQQNTQLQDAIQRNDKQTEALIKKYNKAKTQTEKDSISKQIKQLENEFLANQKLKEGDKLLYGKKDYREAIKLYTEALKFNPNLTEAYGQRGIAYYDLKNYKLAVDDLSKAIELNPKDKSAYFYINFCFDHLKDYNRSIEYCNKFIKIHPDYCSGYNRRAENYEEIKDYANAVADYTKVIELSPKDKNPDYLRHLDSDIASAYFRRAWAYHKWENYELAIQDFKKCLQLKPNNYNAYISLAYSYKEAGNYTESINLCIKAIENNKDK